MLVLPSSPTSAREQVATAPGSEFKNSGWHRFWFGKGYRDLWTTPVRVPVLDLGREGGGLTPVEQVGQLQTAGLAFAGADHRRYWFRSLHKQPDRALPPEWRQGWTSQLIRDRTASTHPAAGVVRSRLAAAAGIPIPPVRLVMMPDDTALGPFRATFANQIGTIEEFPRVALGSPGYLGATEIVDSATLWARRLANPEIQPDGRAYLRARILDLFVGDNDRNHEQRRWAWIPNQRTFVPLPEDPDMAFARQDGFVMARLRGHEPRFQVFSDRYPKSALGELSQADLDRWVLSPLDRAAFREEAEKLQAAFTDAVIDEAVRTMPVEWQARNGKALASALKSRRNALLRDIRRMYLFLSRVVEVHATDASEIVTLHRVQGGIELAVAKAAAPAVPYFRRTFHPSETQELRVYLHGGDDRLVNEVTESRIGLRVVTGTGKDVVDDTRGGHAEVWTGEGQGVVERGPGTSEKRQPWVNRSPAAGAPWLEPRNTGSWKQFGPKAFWAPDLGAVVGLDASYKSWDFRKGAVLQRTLLPGHLFVREEERPRRLPGHFHPVRLSALHDPAHLRLGHRPRQLLRLRKRHPELGRGAAPGRAEEHRRRAHALLPPEPEGDVLRGRRLALLQFPRVGEHHPRSDPALRHGAVRVGRAAAGAGARLARQGRALQHLGRGDRDVGPGDHGSEGERCPVRGRRCLPAGRLGRQIELRRDERRPIGLRGVEPLGAGGPSGRAALVRRVSVVRRGFPGRPQRPGLHLPAVRGRLVTLRRCRAASVDGAGPRATRAPRGIRLLRRRTGLARWQERGGMARLLRRRPPHAPPEHADSRARAHRHSDESTLFYFGSGFTF